MSSSFAALQTFWNADPGDAAERSRANSKVIQVPDKRAYWRSEIAPHYLSGNATNRVLMRDRIELRNVLHFAQFHGELLSRAVRMLQRPLITDLP